MIIAWGMMFVWSIFLIPMMIGAPKGRPIEKWRYALVNCWIKPPLRVFLFTAGVTWMSKGRKRDIDYKKWLGPDWKLTFDGAGIQVSNH